MFESIEWRAYFKVKTIDKARLLLHQVEKAIEKTAELISCERYWKDQTLYEVRFNAQLQVDEVSDAIFQSLLIGKKISHHWMILGPNESNQYWDFEALSDKPAIPGVVWIIYRISNNLGIANLE